MPQFLRDLEKEWRLCARAEPGQRFISHHRRSQGKRSFAWVVARVTAGTALTATGVLLWFLPGPGWLFVFLGLALLAGESRALASFLDRAEMTVRMQARRMRRWWHAASPALRAVAIISALTGLVGLGSATAWVLWA